MKLNSKNREQDVKDLKLYPGNLVASHNYFIYTNLNGVTNRHNLELMAAGDTK